MLAKSFSSLLCLAALPALAESPPQTDSAMLHYQSVFTTYQPWMVEVPTSQWQRINADMEKLGGHVGHVKNSAPILPDTNKPKNPHAGHTGMKP